MSGEKGSESFWEAVDNIRERDKRYEADAYAFVMGSLDYAIRLIGKRRHVSAAELLAYLCEYGKERYGVLAYSVLETWGIRSTEDVGSVVYQLIEERVLAEQEGDSPADFNGVFDLRRCLEEHYFTRPAKKPSGDPRS